MLFRSDFFRTVDFVRSSGENRKEGSAIWAFVAFWLVFDQVRKCSRKMALYNQDSRTLPVDIDIRNDLIFDCSSWEAFWIPPHERHSVPSFPVCAFSSLEPDVLEAVFSGEIDGVLSMPVKSFVDWLVVGSSAIVGHEENQSVVDLIAL